MIIVLATLFFTLFTVSVIIEQTRLIHEGTSTVDRLKQKKDKMNAEPESLSVDLKSKIPPYSKNQISYSDSLNEVMGRKGFLCLLWLIPYNFKRKSTPEQELSKFYIWQNICVWLLN